jgi:hypothetical protein
MPIWSRYRYRVEDYWPLIQVLRQSNKYTHGLLVPLSAEEAARPKRGQTRGEQRAVGEELPLSVELEDQAVDRSSREQAREAMTEEERREDDRRHFRFQPDLDSPDLLAHRGEGPREVKGTRVIPVPEGWVILGRKAAYREYQKHLGLPELVDLRHSPSIRLVPFIIRWRPEFSDQKLERTKTQPERQDRTLEEGRLSLQVNRDFVRLKLKIVHEMTSRMHFYESVPGGTWAAWRKEAELIKGVNQVTRELIALKRWAFVESDTYAAYDTEVRRRVKIWLTSVRHRKAEEAQAILWKYVLPWRYNPEKLPSKLALKHRAAHAAGEMRSRQTT